MPFKTLIKDHLYAVVLFCAALISGLLFVFLQPHPGLWGDALGYYKASIQIYDVMFTGGNPNLSVFLIRSPWLVYALSGLHIAFGQFGNEAFMSAAFLLNMVFYTINLLLIYAVTLKITGSKKPALGCMLAAWLYTPFLLYTDQLLRETMHATFILAFAWCFLTQRDRWGYLFLFLALTSNYFAASVKGIALLLIAVAGHGAYTLLGGSKTDSAFLKRMAGYALWFFIPFAILHALFGLIDYQALDAVTLAQFGDTKSWGVIAPFHGEITLRTAEHVLQLPDVFNVLSKSLQDTLKWALFAPEQFLTNYTTNLYRFFAHPSNVYNRTWLLTPDMLSVYHQFLIAAFALSVPLALKNKKLWLFLTFILSWVFLFSMVHIEDRYNVVVMPFVLITATYGVHALLKAHAPAQATRLISGLLLFTAILIMWFRGVLYPLFLPLGLTPSLYYFLGVLAGGVGFGIIYTRILTAQILTVQQPVLRVSPPMLGFIGALIIFTPILVTLVLGPVQLESKTVLKNQTIAKKIIPLDDKFFVWPGLKTYLLVDTTPFPTSECFDVSINEQTVSLEGLTLPKGLLMQKYLTGDGLLPVDTLRQYAFIPLPDSLNLTKEAHISLFNKCTNGPSLVLYGDYPASHNNLYWLPSPHWGEYSIYKAIYDRDGRIPHAISATEGSKSLINGQEQPFQFRIMLLRLMPEEGRRWGYPMAEFHVDDKDGLYKIFTLAY